MEITLTFIHSVGAFIWNLLASVPDVIWSGVVASAITLSGVIASNKSNNNRLVTQLEHDAKEKDKERNFTLRKTVYLANIDEVMKVADILNNLANEDIFEINITDKFSLFSSALYQLEIVAQPKTAKLIKQLSSSYSELLHRVIEQLYQVRTVKEDVDINERLQDAAQERCQSALDEMRKLVSDPGFSRKVYDHLNGFVEKEREQMDNFHRAKVEALKNYSNTKAAFHKKVIEEVIDLKIKELQSKVLLSMREDLGFIDH